MLSVGAGGYMQQWVDVTDRGDNPAEGGVDIQWDSGIHFRDSLESDMGLKYTVHIQLEANRDNNKAAQIEESFARIGADFGTIGIGARDSIQRGRITGSAMSASG